MRNPIEIVLRPKARWWGFNPGELWAYRDLVWLLVRRDFVARFRQTLLGPLWYVVNPLVTTATFTVIFGQVANISTDGLPQVLFYNAGLLLWNYFQGLSSAAAGTFTANAGLFGKVYFPRLAIPVAAALSALVQVVIQVAVFGALYLVFKFGPAGDTFAASPWAVLVLPLLVLQTAALALGVGFWISALTARYRDLAHVFGFALQLVLYATPVIYPLSVVTDPWAAWMALNPLVFVVESARWVLLGSGSVSVLLAATSVGLTAFILGSGILLFQRAERTFVDTV